MLRKIDKMATDLKRVCSSENWYENMKTNAKYEICADTIKQNMWRSSHE